VIEEERGEEGGVMGRAKRTSSNRRSSGTRGKWSNLFRWNQHYQGGGGAQQLGPPDTLPVLILALAYPQP
jgi:hypothetical protein